MLISLHPSSHDFINRSHESLETVSINTDQLSISNCNHIGSSWLINQQSPLSEVISWLVPGHFNCLLTFLLDNGGNQSALFHQEELVSILPLSNNSITGEILLVNEGVREERPFIGFHGFKDLDLEQEVLILLPLYSGGIPHNVIKGLSVQYPK